MWEFAKRTAGQKEQQRKGALFQPVKVRRGQSHNKCLLMTQRGHRIDSRGTSCRQVTDLPVCSSQESPRR